MNERLTAMEKKVFGKVDTLEEKLTEVERNTLWKIKDCEDLLKTRVSERYVDDSIQTMEDRLKGEV